MSDSDASDPTPAPPPDPVAEPASQVTEPAPPTAASGKADNVKRFVAFIIDAVIASVLTSVIPVLGGVLGGLYMLLRDGFDFEFMRYRSLGKRLMGLRPVLVGGGAMTMQVSMRRNWPFAFSILTIIPVLGFILAVVIAPILGVIEGVLVLTNPEGRRFGDQFAGTKVIESAD